MSRHKFFILLLLLLGIASSCNNESKPPTKPAPDSNAAAPNTEVAAPPATTNTEAAPALSPNQPKHLSIDTNRNAGRALAPSTKTAPKMPSPETLRNKPPGPPGYVTRNDVILQTEPSPNAAKIGALKQYEIVYILETIMTDEQGRHTPYPTWYKVERENKQKGWVVAKGLNAGAGG